MKFPRPRAWQWLLVLVLAGIVGLASLLPRPVGPDAGSRFAPVRGVALGLFYEEDRREARRSLDEIAALGATHVSIPIPMEQESVESESLLAASPMQLPDSLLVAVARETRARGMSPVFFPLLNVQRSGPGKWRGTLSPARWESWFGSYGDHLLHYARLAEAARADGFFVGAELNSSEAHARQWRVLIARVRRVYRGRLLYSQNWDYEPPIAFASQLDQVGFNGYFGLGEDSLPSAVALERRWAALRPGLLARARACRTPLLITELGYPSSTSGAARPWDYLESGAYAPGLQRNCFEAFFRAWDRQPGFQGAFLYLWTARAEDGDRGYSLRGKPAAKVAGAWYRRGFPASRGPKMEWEREDARSHSKEPPPGQIPDTQAPRHVASSRGPAAGQLYR